MYSSINILISNHHTYFESFNMLSSFCGHIVGSMFMCYSIAGKPQLQSTIHLATCWLPASFIALLVFCVSFIYWGISYIVAPQV